MKTIYLVRNAKAESFSGTVYDYERGLRKQGLKDIKTIGSYLLLQGIVPSVILSSYALRAQETATYLSEIIGFNGERHFLEELYFSSYEEILKIIMAQNDKYKSILIIGHNPNINELSNALAKEYISKIPAMGVVSLQFDTDSWSTLEENKGKIDFFIYPKQFKYYMPRQIRTLLD